MSKTEESRPIQLRPMSHRRLPHASLPSPSAMPRLWRAVRGNPCKNPFVLFAHGRCQRRATMKGGLPRLEASPSNKRQRGGGAYRCHERGPVAGRGPALSGSRDSQQNASRVPSGATRGRPRAPQDTPQKHPAPRGQFAEGVRARARGERATQPPRSIRAGSGRPHAPSAARSARAARCAASQQCIPPICPGLD